MPVRLRDLAEEQRESSRTLRERARVARESSIRLRDTAKVSIETRRERDAQLFHDLKAPLGAISMWLHMLKTSDAEKWPSVLEALEASVGMLAQQISALSTAETEEPSRCANGNDELPSSVDLSSLRVLVVDDDDRARDALAAVLEKYGCFVVTAASGREALESLGSARADLVVSDIQMPDGDGYALVREMRARGDAIAATPAIAMTGGGAQHGPARALDAGFQAHVTKPAAVSTLLTLVAKLAKRASPMP